ncbi:MAG TPA: O-antigen ligase family protein, partial [Syntrophales bacterium]|nr:O-antigen ligase family protein [Syntrophales bacterium]
YLLFNFFNTKKRLHILIWTIIISTVIFSVWIMIYYYLILGHPILGPSPFTKLGLLMGEIASNIIGISTLFAMLLCLYQFTREEIGHRKILLAICFCITAIATLATQTRGSILAMFVSLLLSFPKNKKTITVIFLFLAIFIVLMPVRNILTPPAIIERIHIMDDRINAWYCFGEMVKDYPLTGIGFGMQTYADDNLLNKYNEKVPIKYRQPEPMKAPHNLVVDIAVRLGLVGLASFFYILFEFFRMGRHIIKNNKDDFFGHWSLCLMVALTALFIQGMFENTMSGPPAIVFYTIMAMMAILWHLNKKQDIDGQSEVVDNQTLSGQRGSPVG